MKLIKLPEGYIIVSDGEIKESNWGIRNNVIERCNSNMHSFALWGADAKKVIASTFHPELPQIEFDLSDENFKKISGIYTDYDIEIEMDKIPADRAPNGWDVFPKITDGKIKVIKIL